MKQLDFMNQSLVNFIQTASERRQTKINEILSKSLKKQATENIDTDKQINQIVENSVNNLRLIPMKVLDSVIVKATAVKTSYEKSKKVWHQVLLYTPLVAVSTSLFIFFVYLIGNTTNVTRQSNEGYDVIIKQESTGKI
jgi:hypothetical protein